MNAVIYNRVVPSSSRVIPRLVDHRYFYDKDDNANHDVGYYTCGLSRDVVFPLLLIVKGWERRTILLPMYAKDKPKEEEEVER